MIYIILAWIFWFLFCFNIGFFVLRIIFKKDNKKIDFFYNFWFGLFSFVLVLEIISLFHPLNGKVLTYSIAFNLFLFLLNLRNIKFNWRLILRNIFQHIDYKKILLFVILAFFVSFLSNLPVTWYDTNLYHLNSIKWLTDYGSVKGLANLQFPLGINNVTFLLAAIMNHGVFTNSSSHVMNSFLVFVFASQIILFLFRKPKNILAYFFGLFSILILSIFIGQYYFIGQINSLSTDLSMAIFLLLFNFYFMLFERENLVLSMPILILAATSKFSCFIVLALFSLFILIELKDKVLLKKNVYILFLSFIFLVSFIIRNLILSGWALFPFPYFGLNFKWQVPLEQLKNINNVITGFARLPGPYYLSSVNANFWDWFISWFNYNKNNPSLYYIFLLFFLIFMYFYSTGKSKKQLSSITDIRKVNFLVLASTATLLYTFLTAPDLRYMGIFIFVSISLILSSFFVNFFKYDFFKSTIILVFIFLISSYLFKAITLKEQPELFIVQKEESSLVRSVTVSYSDQSFYIWMPVNGDQCVNSQLPCAPSVGKFKMFQPGNIKSGFYPTQETPK